MNFNLLCDWFVDNKLSIHLGEDQTKSKNILFGTKKKLKRLRELDIRYGDVKIKQHPMSNILVVYLIVAVAGNRWHYMH